MWLKKQTKAGNSWFLVIIASPEAHLAFLTLCHIWRQEQVWLSDISFSLFLFFHNLPFYSLTLSLSLPHDLFKSVFLSSIAFSVPLSLFFTLLPTAYTLPHSYSTLCALLHKINCYYSLYELHHISLLSLFSLQCPKSAKTNEKKKKFCHVEVPSRPARALFIPWALAVIACLATPLPSRDLANPIACSGWFQEIRNSTQTYKEYIRVPFNWGFTVYYAGNLEEDLDALSVKMYVNISLELCLYQLAQPWQTW